MDRSFSRHKLVNIPTDTRSERSIGCQMCLMIVDDVELEVQGCDPQLAT